MRARRPRSQYGVVVGLGVWGVLLGTERIGYTSGEGSMQQRAGIFGYPLSHSISPAFQQAAFDHHALPATYDAWPVAPEGLPDAIGKLYGDDHLGANVTVPHKEAALELMDEVDPVAQRIGAVNTIVRRGDRLVGYNTDLDGFVKGLKSHGGFEPGGKRALLLGAGGAARAAAFGLAEERVASLTIANRTVGRAESLAREVSGVLATVSAIGLTDRAVASAAADCDLIVNSTSIGMSGGDGDGQTPVGAGCIRPTFWCTTWCTIRSRRRSCAKLAERAHRSSEGSRCSSTRAPRPSSCSRTGRRRST